MIAKKHNMIRSIVQIHTVNTIRNGVCSGTFTYLKIRYANQINNMIICFVMVTPSAILYKSSYCTFTMAFTLALENVNYDWCTIAYQLNMTTSKTMQVVIIPNKSAKKTRPFVSNTYLYPSNISHALKACAAALKKHVIARKIIAVNE